MLGNQEEERSVHFQGRKISKGMLIFVVADIWNCYNMDMKKANWNLWRKDKMDRPITTLFMLMSVDGKISTGATDDLDVDKDFPKIKGVNEGLHQYYEIEQTTDLWSFNSGRVQEKMGVNKKKIPRKTPVSFVVIDNKLLHSTIMRRSFQTHTLSLMTSIWGEVMVVVGIILTSYAINFVVPFPEKDDFVTIIQKAFIIREVIRTGKIPMVSFPKMRTVLIGLHGKNILHSILAQVHR